MYNFYPTSQETDEFSKKCLWWLYFSTTRLKKFIYTWSFRPYRKVANRSENIVTDIELESKEVIFHVPFYIEVRETRELGKDDYPYRVRVQYQDFTRNMPPHVKEEIMDLTRKWYNTYKDAINYGKDRHQSADIERIQFIQRRDR
jgi:hypothetical protein